MFDSFIDIVFIGVCAVVYAAIFLAKSKPGGGSSEPGSREFTQDSSGSEDVEAARRMVEEMKRGISPGHAAEDSRKVIGEIEPVDETGDVFREIGDFTDSWENDSRKPENGRNYPSGSWDSGAEEGLPQRRVFGGECCEKESPIENTGESSWRNFEPDFEYADSENAISEAEEVGLDDTARIEEIKQRMENLCARLAELNAQSSQTQPQREPLHNASAAFLEGGSLRLRDAVVASEIISPPLALRRQPEYEI